MNAQMLLQSFAGGDDEKTYVDDVFSTYLYTGNGSTQTINNGIDLAGKGGMVWTKIRNFDGSIPLPYHYLSDTVRGADQLLSTNDASLQRYLDANTFVHLDNGFRVKDVPGWGTNSSGYNYTSWTFRRAPKFFKCATVTKSAGSNATVDLSSLGAVGMVTVKRTDSAGDWYTWHRSLDSGKLMYLNQSAAAATLGHITVSGTTLTLINGVIADGTYAIYAWAHDTSPNGLIQCGSFTTDASGNATVTTGWEPQFIKIKASSATSDWMMIDSMRGMPVGGADARLYANTIGAEASANTIDPTATGFNATSLSASTTYIYLAIRRPNKPPKTGAEVYNAIAYTGDGNDKRKLTGVGFPPDMYFSQRRNATHTPSTIDRLRGAQAALFPNGTGAEYTGTAFADSWLQDGVVLGSDGDIRGIVSNIINHFFRRASGFFDVVCDTGTGSAHAINHSLTVAPELIIRKSRSASTQWEWWHSALAATEKLVLNSTAGKVTDATAFGTLPTATQFYVGASSNTNASAATYVTYLFATCPGVSKVGYYTGNGTSLTVECGFSTGARFILAKSIDDAGDSYIWDSTRGVVAANDPHLSLNTTAAEVTTDDSVDPYAGGFIVNQNTATNINITGKRYIFLAIA